MLTARRAGMTTMLALALATPPTAAAAVDRDRAEQTVRETIASDLGRQLRSVTCPDDIPQATGESVTCQLVGTDGSRASAIATVTPDGFIVDFALLDTRAAENEIARAVRRQAGVSVRRVDCPHLAPVDAGNEFVCTVVGGDRSKGPVAVRQKDGKGNSTFNAPVLHIREAERSITRQIKRQTGIKGVRVDCRDIVMARKGTTFGCKGTSDKGRFLVDAVMTDNKGRFRFKTRSQ